ncbi:toll-like receptor Tollo [Euwallacea fornicatus]|uniref:toll-like receptor Tollo n=1 Tax=Euwallacea fornicatus TaxID=995702 RepID=UPI00338E6C2F
MKCSPEKLLKMNRLILVSAILVSVSARSLTSAPRGCDWQMQPSEDPETLEEPVLYCQIRTINNAEQLMGNLSQSQMDHVSVLMLECNDVLFFESTLDTSKHGSFLAPLHKLKELRIENCKIRSIPVSAMANLRHLKKLALRSHNSEWSVMTLELQTESFRGLSELKYLDLGDNNIWSTPQDLFCPLYSLTHLNLTCNKLQDIQALGFSDWGKGPLEPGRACVNGLEILDLSNNQIIALPDNGFSALRSLEELHLQDNAIATLGDRSFVGLNAMKTVNLSSNCVVTMPPELFQFSRELTNLYLQNNSLSVLAPGLLEGLDQLRVLDLSHNELTSRWVNRDTFSGLVRLVVLNLGYNQLNRVDSALFHDLYTLQILNLEHNLITVMAEGAFSELKNLHALTLSHNKIARIESYHFAGLYALNQLLLDQNEIEYIHPKSFENVTNLQDLGLNGNMLGGVPAGIGQLRFLKTLDLGKNHIESVTNASFEGLDLLYGLRLVDNHIINVSRDAFSTLPSLQVLNLASNKIKYVEQSAFASNPTLKAIRLDANELTDISGVFTNLQSLVWLNVSSNKLLWFDFSHLPVGLEWLDMHGNQIPELGNYFDVRNALKIKMLDVSFNLITQIQEKSVPDSVETLYLQHNKITSVAPNSFTHKNNLEKVVLYGNKIRYLDLSALNLSPVSDEKDLPQFYIGNNPFYCDCKMEWLLRINHLSNLRQYPQVLDLDDVTCELAHARGAPPQPLLRLKPSNFLCPYQTHCFALCHCCDFDACDCEMTCPDRCSCFHDHTWTSNVVDCSNAGYKEVPEKIPMDATEIYLDGNDLGELGSHVFIGKKKLEFLFLNNSNVKALHNRTFNGAKSLRILHMEDNKLEELRGFEFDQLENINELYLDHNKIGFVGNQTFRNMHNLEVLKLDDNKIVDFSPWQLQAEARASVPRVSLDGNKWSCDCESLSRLNAWIWSSGGDPSKMLCSDVSETVSEALNKCDDLDNAIATSVMQRELVNKHQLLGDSYVPLLAATLVSVIVVCLLVAILFVFRQEVRLWAHSKYGVRIFQDTHENSDDRDHLYDCYMVYSHKDEELAARIIAPELETLGHTLCLHYRDLHLVNGASYLADAMVGAADASRRVVFVVSPALICTEWTKPEFRAALQAALRTSFCHKLVCILSGDPLEPMDPELRSLLRACTVTRWGERRFWEKLRYAMPDVINSSTSRRKKQHPHPEIRCKTNNSRYTSPPHTDTWYKYQAMPGVHNTTLTPTPTQSTYVSGGDSNRSTEDEGSSASSQHYGSEQLNHSYVSIDGRPPQYSQFPNCRSEMPHHVYSTIPDAPPQSRTYFV